MTHLTQHDAIVLLEALNNPTTEEVEDCRTHNPELADALDKLDKLAESLH